MVKAANHHSCSLLTTFTYIASAGRRTTGGGCYGWGTARYLGIGTTSDRLLEVGHYRFLARAHPRIS